jgi:monofunctional biosynthetic peptidoglycan transglycosylase
VLAPFVAYYAFALLLLVVYRFVDPPTTGVRIERRIQAWSAEGEYRVRHTPVPIAALPRHVPRAVVAAEDGRFHQHWGFDLGAMRDAGLDAASGGRMRGASTLTQQLVKNLFGCTCRNPVRKLYDYALTPPAELILGKERILELYLNQVEWGDGVFGIEEAARDRYGVPARRLSRTQAAGLAALLPNPRRRTLQSTAQYRREILRRMRFRGW